MCNLHSHLAIRQELQGQLGDKLTVDMQSDIEQSLEDRLKDFDIDLKNPNFNLPNEEIHNKKGNKCEIKKDAKLL